MALHPFREEAIARRRLKVILKVHGLDRQQFADLVERKLGYINQMLSGNRRVTENVVLKLCQKLPHINPDYILKGDEEMFLEGVPRPEPRIWVADHSNAANVKKVGLEPLNELKARIEAMQARVEALEEEVRRLKGE
ncbi:MAG: helix-turn-helix transcriptional regulator [Saprospiraceae bacterium]